MVHPDDREHVVAAWEEACRNLTEHRVECRLREGKSGGYRWFLCCATPQPHGDGAVVRWFDTCTDIHERKQAEAATEESRRRLEAVFENSLDGIVLFNDALQFADANSAFSQLTGYSRDEILRLTVRDVTPETDRERLSGRLDELRSSGSFSGEFAIVNRWAHPRG